MLLLTKTKVKDILRQSKGKSYTYGLCDKDGTLFYVGVGIRNRVLTHSYKSTLKRDGNKLKTNTILKLNGEIFYVIFLVHTTREPCLCLESKLILKFGRRDNSTGCLTNLTDGGEIGPTGYKLGEEARQRLSVMRKDNSSVYSESNKQHWLQLTTEEQQDKVSKMRSRSLDPDVVAKVASKTKERWADPEYKKRLSEKQKQSQKAGAEENRKRMKANWDNPEWKADMLKKRREARLRKLLNTENPSDSSDEILNKDKL